MTKTSEQIYSEFLSQYKDSKEKVSPELKEKLNQKLVEISLQKQKSKLIKFPLRTALAIAASFVAVLSFLFVFSSFNSDKIERKLIHESTVAQGKPVTVTLIYNAENDFDKVKFSLDLEDGVSFFTSRADIKDKKFHEWTGSLKKGVNKIPFVVETEKLGKMKISAKAEYGKFSHFQEIILDAGESEIAVSMFVLSPVAER